MSKITDIEDFEDLSRCSLEKLTKLRDRARQYRIECQAETQSALDREAAVVQEMQQRQQAKAALAGHPPRRTPDDLL